MKKTVKNLIGAYNQSEGLNLPSDWEEHIVGGDREGTCVFCKSNFAAQVIVPLSTTMNHVAPMPIPVCYSCYDNINTDATPAWFHSQDYLSAGGPQYWKNVVDDYIVPYVEQGIYPDKHDPEKTFEVCDFCGNESSHIYGHFKSFSNIEKDAKVFKHPQPVKKDLNIIEPPVITCIRCESAIEFLALRLPSSYTYKKIVMSNCAACNSSYPIEVTEYEDRKKIANTTPLNSYVCPLCAGELWENCERWVSVECKSCKTERIIDRLDKNYYKGQEGNHCKCKNTEMVKTLTFLYEVKLNNFHISINIIEVECGGVRKNIFTVVNNDEPDDNVLPIGSQYEKCTKVASGSCGCSPVGEDINQKLLDLHLQIFEYLLNHDSS